MKGIDPKYIMWLGLLVTVEQAIGHGTVSLTNLVPATWAPYITSWCNFLAFVGTSVMTYQAAISGPQIGPLLKVPDNITQNVAKVLLVAFALSFLVAGGQASAQTRTRPRLPIDPLGLNNQTIAGTTAAPATATTVKCDFNIFVNLKPENLETFVKTCVDDVNSTLADDTARALESAQNFKPNPDQDAINCLKPGLAIIQAAIPIPAVPAQDAIPATANAPAVAAVAAVPEKRPGLILLYQKYREFTIAGALTSCQSWVNGPINATAAAGIAGAGTAIAGAALLAPK